MISSTASDKEDDLDPEQLAVVTSTEPSIAVLAGPGSGKTRTLSHRTRHLLEKSPHANALLLTFTNKAAAEMKDRAVRASGLSGTRIHACTFHTFCADLLRAHGDLVGLPREFEILDQEESNALALAVSSREGIADASRQCGHARLRRLDVPKGAAAFGEAYQADKLREAVVDFDDLVVFAADLLERYPDVARAYGSRFRHVLVDEFQDTNAVQLAVVGALSDHVETVSIFADDDQAIFGFAGAESENIRRFASRLHAREYQLTINYRSGDRIVELANRLIDADPHSSGRQMRAHRRGGSIRYLAFTSVDEEAARVASDTAGLVARRTPTSDIAVLVRSGYRANLLVAQLAARALPVSDWRGAAHLPNDRRLLSSCLATVRGTLNARQIARLSDLMGVLPIDERRTEAFLATHATQPLARGLMAVRRLAFEGATPHKIAKAVQEAVASQDPAEGESLEDIVEAVSHFELYDREFTLEHLLAELALGSIDRPPTSGGGIKVATLHRTKGLQWQHVYLLGLEGGHLPDYKASGADQISEERRLCFVGVSRAKEQLTFTRAEVSGGRVRQPSLFLAEMGIT